MQLYKRINLDLISTDLNKLKIYINYNKIFMFDLHEILKLLEYSSKGYLVTYYSKHNILLDNNYTNYPGINLILNKSRKLYSKEILEIINNELQTYNLISNKQNKEVTLINKEVTLINKDTKENRIIKEIVKYFGDKYIYKTQYHIDKYYIDLVFTRTNGCDIFVEIDEGYHKYQQENDIQRQNNIMKTHNCKFFRITPDDASFNLNTTLRSLKNVLIIDDI